MRRPKGILENQVDESWIFERDFCFFNIRAVGNVVEEPGNIIDAIKLLPTLRVNAIQLAPFFEYRVHSNTVQARCQLAYKY